MRVPKVFDRNNKSVMSIGWRLCLHVAGISGILSFSILLFLLPFRYNRVEQDMVIEARILAEAVSNTFQHLMLSHPPEYARRLLLRMARMPHIHMVNVLDQNGIVSYSTDSRELGKKYDTGYGISRDDGYIIVTHVVPERESSVGSVNVVINKDLMLADTHRFFMQVSIGLLLMIVVLSVLIKGLTDNLIASRLAKLLSLIKNAELGSFLIRADIDRYDEIGQVMMGFNQLLAVITQIEARKLEKDHNLERVEIEKNMRIKLEETLFQLERSNEKLKRKVSAQELLMEAAHRLGATLEKDSVLERLVSLVREKLMLPKFMIFLMEGPNKDKQWLRIRSSYGFLDYQQDNEKIALGEGIVGVVAQTGSPLLISNLDAQSQAILLYQNHPKKHFNTEGLVSLLAIPILHKGKVIGVFLLGNHKIGAFDTDDVTLMSALAAQTALAIVNAELYEKTLELATLDPLTGVLNRRAMVKQIEFELARASRFNTSLALLLIDVDHFKSYNDRMGHVLGDVALKEIALTLKDNIRKVDILARFGGEEFCVILPQTDIISAREVAKKLCEAIRCLDVRGAEKQELGYLSISIGIALVSFDNKEANIELSITDIIAQADKALYEAKKLGRDRFVEG